MRKEGNKGSGGKGLNFLTLKSCRRKRKRRAPMFFFSPLEENLKERWRRRRAKEEDGKKGKGKMSTKRRKKALCLCFLASRNERNIEGNCVIKKFQTIIKENILFYLENMGSLIQIKFI